MASGKQIIKSVLETLHLGKAADYIRFGWQYLQNYDAIKKAKAQWPSEPFPKPFMIYETFKLNYERYWLSGLEDAQFIYQAILPYKNLNQARLLEWGCGPGRIIRHWPKLLGKDAQVNGTDYNTDYIRWCTQNLKGIQFKTNQLLPPLAFDAGSMDVVYAISIFTHLSEASIIAWIHDMYRVLDKNGIFYFTTHGDITKRHLLSQEMAQYDAGRIVVRGNVKEGYRMYCTYHPPQYMQTCIEAAGFKVLQHIPGQEKDWGLEQDIWIIQKS
jgi:ubiquinone/menaquinone biosynthesis C-methylase UbiE